MSFGATLARERSERQDVARWALAALATYLSMGGLTLDILGAAFLGYDVLYGPEARFEAVILRDRLAVAMRSRARDEAELRELSPNAPEERARGLRAEMQALAETSDETIAELRRCEKQALRARRQAMIGLLLLMAGFAGQGLGTFLATRGGSVQIAP